ncbi:MAG TPA: conjugal transfer protein TraD [Symbiobacteriaceae bacterium]|nr:conjugal transfer protein TraD [Symbiobacteriaceae bacterium]
MAGKSLEQRMADTETRIRQLEAQKRLLAQQVKAQARRERTRQLIQIGGILARLGFDTVEKVQVLQRVVEERPEVQAWFRDVANWIKTTSPVEADSSDEEYRGEPGRP